MAVLTGGTGGSGGGATTLSGLTDVSVAGAAQGDVFYYNGSAWVKLTAGTSGQFLKTQGAGANPTWDTVAGGGASALDYLSDVTASSPSQGDILYYNGSGWVKLAKGADGQFLKSTTGNPAWDSIGGGGDLLASNNLSDVNSAATARQNLDLEIGVDVQAYSAVLAATTASFTTADETKLDGIEALADVTDYDKVISSLSVDPSSLSNGNIIDVKRITSQNTSACSVGELCYISGSETWSPLDATSSEGAIGICVISNASTGVVALLSLSTLYKNTSYSFTAGDLLYSSSTAGDITATSPTTTGDEVVPIGFALTTDTVVISNNINTVTYTS